jgi:hypothetical protein
MGVMLFELNGNDLACPDPINMLSNSYIMYGTYEPPMELPFSAAEKRLLFFFSILVMMSQFYL